MFRHNTPKIIEVSTKPTQMFRNNTPKIIEVSTKQSATFLLKRRKC
jgi:hypothetical protein